MLQILDADCLGLCLLISPQFTLRMCARARNCKKNHKNPKFWELNVIGVGTTGKIVSSACYDKQQDCVYQRPISC